MGRKAEAERALELAAVLLREVQGLGYTLYLDGSGGICALIGPSHDEKGAPRQHAIAAREVVNGFGGGDW